MKSITRLPQFCLSVVLSLAVLATAQERPTQNKAAQTPSARLQQVVTGYYNYHAVPGNLTSFSLFRARLSRIWRHQLRQRGDQRKIAWTKFARICLRYLPPPRTLHSHPYQRFNVTHPKVGAVCVKYARTVLCGGRFVRVVPTATSFSKAKGEIAPFILLIPEGGTRNRRSGLLSI